jgi:hypothetical protein
MRLGLNGKWVDAVVLQRLRASGGREADFSTALLTIKL